MQKVQDPTKATWTALIISPPKNLQGEIQKIRQKHDKAYERWMPHINICFPFVKPELFKDFMKEFAEDFEQMKPFKIHFNKYQAFDHGKNSVMYLQPETDDGGQSIQNILRTILKKRPELNDQDLKSDKGFTPHLTCGTFPTKNIDKTLQDFQKQFQPFSFDVNEVYLIQREGKDNPFYISQTLKLGEKSEIVENDNKPNQQQNQQQKMEKKSWMEPENF